MGDWIVGIGLGLVLVAIFVLAFLRRHLELKQIDVWRELARRANLTYSDVAPNFPRYTYPNLHGVYRNREVSFGSFNPYDREHYAAVESPLITLSVNNPSLHSFTLDFSKLPSKGEPSDLINKVIRVIAPTGPDQTPITKHSSKIKLDGDNLFCWQNGVVTDIDEQISLLDQLCNLAEFVEGERA